MSSVKALFPAGILPWTDRIDQTNIVFAVDVNTLASEIIAIETNVGVNPQIEPTPPTGLPITYASMSARLTDAINNNQLPVCHLQNPQFFLNNVDKQVQNKFVTAYDPFKMFNGVDMTIPASGWWTVSATQTWGWWDDGYVHFQITINGVNNILAEHLFSWDLPENQKGHITGRFIKFGQRTFTGDLWWQGVLNKGDRISVYSENGTTHPNHPVTGSNLKASMHKSISGSVVSG